MTSRVEIDSPIKPLIFVHDGIHAFFTTNLLNNNLLDSIAKLASIPKKNIYLPIQKHTNKIHVLDSDLKPVIADAVLTEKKGLLIGVQVADCVPILLYDGSKGVIGAVHAGWRGTAAQILKNTIRTMQERFSSSPEDILIAMGPSIRQCCYEVDDEVKDALYKVTGEGDYYQRQNGRYFIDLLSANRIQALSMDVPQQNIWHSEECTCCNPDKFYSYRYAKGTNGRQGGFIGMW
jgi:YfiH family protein